LIQRVLVGADNVDDLFNKDELTKLESSLGMNNEKIAILVRGLLEFVLDAVYHCISPQAMATALKKYPLADSKRIALVEVWENTAVLVLETLKDKSLLPKVRYTGVI